MDRKITVTMLRTACPDGISCPSVHKIDTDPTGRYVISKRVTDPAVLDAFAPFIAPDEVLGRVPDTLLPEV